MFKFLLGSFDMDTDEEEKSVEQCVDCYKVKSKMDMDISRYSDARGVHNEGWYHMAYLKDLNIKMYYR